MNYCHRAVGPSLLIQSDVYYSVTEISPVLLMSIYLSHLGLPASLGLLRSQSVSLTVPLCILVQISQAFCKLTTFMVNYDFLSAPSVFPLPVVTWSHPLSQQRLPDYSLAVNLFLKELSRLGSISVWRMCSYFSYIYFSSSVIFQNIQGKCGKHLTPSGLQTASLITWPLQLPLSPRFCSPQPPTVLRGGHLGAESNAPWAVSSTAWLNFLHTWNVIFSGFS